jgi:uncharacterized protein (TIGR00251 family)
MNGIAQETGGCILTVKVVPRASRTEVVGADPDWVRIRLRAPPVEGRANAALVEFLAETLEIPKRAVAIVAGDLGRIKKVRIAGRGADAVRAKLGV